MTSPAVMKLSVRLQDVASSLADVLDDIAGEPIPFVLVLQAGGVAQYVSNVERKDGRDLLESLIERWDAGRADIPAHMNPDLPKGAAPEPPAQQPMMDRDREVWRAALTLANNICVQESDRYNGDDRNAEAEAAARCARRCRMWIDPEDEQLAELLDEAGIGKGESNEG